ncbi:hypothetical protein [Nocardia brasiliensis]|uniref:hypothetical protein n=1 Tax=Nocardia brasiliensis TaxID=37326 RepID=UPI0024545E01|nr:hypothetical protein [Nocardia brasiliensis]
MTTAPAWKKYGDVDEYGAQEYRSHHDGVYMAVRMFGERGHFTIGLHEWSPKGIDSGHADSFEDATTQAQTAAALFIEAGRPQQTVMKFSAAGPCLTQGVLLGESDKFVFYLDSARKRRVKKTPGSQVVHIEPCSRCGGTYND